VRSVQALRCCCDGQTVRNPAKCPLESTRVFYRAPGVSIVVEHGYIHLLTHQQRLVQTPQLSSPPSTSSHTKVTLRTRHTRHSIARSRAGVEDHRRGRFRTACTVPRHAFSEPRESYSIRASRLPPEQYTMLRHCVPFRLQRRITSRPLGYDQHRAGFPEDMDG
jgi:hypothetical protein